MNTFLQALTRRVLKIDVFQIDSLLHGIFYWLRVFIVRFLIHKLEIRMKAVNKIVCKITWVNSIWLKTFTRGQQTCKCIRACLVRRSGCFMVHFAVRRRLVGLVDVHRTLIRHLCRVQRYLVLKIKQFLSVHTFTLLKWTFQYDSKVITTLKWLSGSCRLMVSNGGQCDLRGQGGRHSQSSKTNNKKLTDRQCTYMKKFMSCSTFEAKQVMHSLRQTFNRQKFTRAHEKCPSLKRPDRITRQTKKWKYKKWTTKRCKVTLKPFFDSRKMVEISLSFEDAPSLPLIWYVRAMRKRNVASEHLKLNSKV